MKKLIVLVLMLWAMPAMAYMSRYQVIRYYARTGQVGELARLNFSLDITNPSGNTALCSAVLEGDKLSVDTLVKAGANAQAPCMKSIPAEYKEWVGLQNAFSQGVTTTSASGGDIFLGAVGGAALVAGGVAVAVSAGSGGGGGGSDKNEKLECIHGTAKKDGGCVCSGNWMGPTCGLCSLTGAVDVAICACKDGYSIKGANTCVKDCDTNAYALQSCPTGANCSVCEDSYGKHYAVDSCKESAGWISKDGECVARDCSGYTLSCADGYIRNTSGGTCKSAGKEYFTCMTNPCTGYDLTSCPANMECTWCKSGTVDKAKISSCKRGWEGASCNTPKTCGPEYKSSCPSGYTAGTKVCYSGNNELKECVAVNCSSYSASCGPGYDSSEACVSENKPYYKCTPKVVPSGYQTTPCSDGYAKQNEMLSGETKYYLCTPLEVPSGYQSTPCDATGYNTESTFLSGTKTYYKCTPKTCASSDGYVLGNTCGDGYTKVGSCFSGTIEYAKCQVKDCSAYSTSCDSTGYNSVEACLSGDTQYYSCVPKSCDGYTTSGTTCAQGYTKIGDVCYAGESPWVKCEKVTCDAAYNTPGGCGNGYESDGEPCYSGGTAYYKCKAATCNYSTTSCGEGYEETGNTCVSGETVYKECQAKSCTGYIVGECPPTAASCQTCMRGNVVTHLVTSCKRGWEGDECDTAHTCGNQFRQNCGDGYHTGTEQCYSGNTAISICEANDCTNPNYHLSCDPGYTSTKACQSRETNYYTCEANECPGYSLTTIPAHATYDTCQTPTGPRYKITACDSTYTKAQNGLSCIKDCDTKYTQSQITACPTHGVCSQCTDANGSYVALDSCNDNRSMSTNCASCKDEYVEDLNGTCVQSQGCDPSKHLVQDGNQCVCEAGYVMVSGECKENNWRTAPQKSTKDWSNVSEYNRGNFLSQIHADKAYNRGYTGYVVNREEDGKLKKIEDASKKAFADNDYITNQRVKVGVIDNGTDVNHPDLNIIKDAAGKPYGWNADLGPCRNGDTTNCYGVTDHPDSDTTYIVTWHISQEQSVVLGNLSKSEWNSWANGYSENYDWDRDGKDATPITGTVAANSNTVKGDHGTHVAGIIGATMNDVGMQGVAPNVEIIPIKLISAGYSGWSGVEEYMAKYKAIELGAKVMNGSYGVYLTDPNTGLRNDGVPTISEYLNMTDTEQMKAWKYVVGYGKQISARLTQRSQTVWVAAAGNDGNIYEPGIDVAIPLIGEFKQGEEYDLTNLWVTVASVDRKNQLASYSQVCGKTAPFCVAAPGGDTDRGVGFFNYRYSGNTSGIAGLNLDTYAEEIAWTDQLISIAGTLTNAELNRRIKAYWGITSTVPNNASHSYVTDQGVSYGYMQGTSMATPVVTGAIALLMGAYPHLKPQQVVSLLFQTADYLEATDALKNLSGKTWTYEEGEGAGGHKYNSVYGYGIINLDAATDPVRFLSMQLPDVSNAPDGVMTSNYLIDSSNLTLSKDIQDKIMATVPDKVVAFDAFARPFAVDTKQLFANTQNQRRTLFRNDFKTFRKSANRQTVKPSDYVSFAFNAPVTNQQSQLPWGSIEMAVKPTDSWKFTTSYQENTMLGERDYFHRHLENPFVNMNKAYSFGAGYSLNKKTDILFQYTHGRNAFFVDEEDDDVYNQRMGAFQGSVVFRPMKEWTLSVIGGTLKEKESILGMLGSDAFAFDGADTYFGGVKLKYQATPALSIEGSYYRGIAKPRTHSEYASFSDLKAEGFAINTTYAFADNQQIGFDIYSPLRIVSGELRMRLPRGRHPTENKAYYDSYAFSMKPQRREWDFSVFYQDELSDALKFRSQVGVRLNPEHQDNSPDYFGLMGLSLKY